MRAERNYTLELDVVAAAGEGKPRMNSLLKSNPSADLSLGLANMHEAFLRGHNVDPTNHCLGRREVDLLTGELAPHYSWLTYADVLARSTSLGSGLAKLGVRLGESVGFFSKNSVEYFVAREACSQYGFVSVPLYDTLGPDAVSHIVGEADVTVVLTVSDKLVELLDQVAGKRVHHVVLMDNNERGAVAVSVLRQANAVGVQVLDMAAVEALGGAGTLIPPDRKPQPADVLLICYTSGSTSVPKGAIITHRNMLATLASITYLQKQHGTYAVTSADTALSYLPLAHLMEQGLSFQMLCSGGRIGLYSGDVARVLEDLAILQPTVFTAVPRILNRLHDRVWATVRAKGGLALRMFEHAYDTKKAALHTTGATTHWLWDRLVFKTIRSLLGGNIRFLLSGSAPLSLEVLDFLRIASGAEVVSEGYGMTETTCGASLSSIDDVEAGHVGPPIPGLQIKLVDIPEMSYFSSDTPHPRGEICIKGANIFAGYHKQPEKTAEALDHDGWLHTGDVGLWDERGRLRIIDRVKNLVKLSQGEYVALERVENVFVGHPVVAQMLLYGDSLKSFLVSVIVPDEEALRAFVAEKVPVLGSAQNAMGFAQLCQHPLVRDAVVSDLGVWGRRAGLNGYEVPRNVHLTTEPFTPENAILTPTLKLKRNVARDVFKKHIEEMYATTPNSEGQVPPSSKL